MRWVADGYLAAHGGNVLPSHKRAITDIMAYRTGALGGHVWRCGHCSAEVYSYHSCKNRSWPKCHTDQTERWLAARQAEVLPCRYFHITVTVPEELRETLRANQKACYPLLMKAAGEAIIELPAIPAMWAARPACWRFLHTWTQQLLYHPHVHCLVTGGGVAGGNWLASRHSDFLVPTPALARLVRGKLKAMLAKHCPGVILPKAIWTKRWVVHATAWGEGAEAVLRYLARYVFRTAITNNRLVSLDESGVAFRHKLRASNRWRITRLKADEFMRRFLQHVLPKGPHKVRYFGLWHPAKRGEAARVRLLLQLEQRSAAAADATPSMIEAGIAESSLKLWVTPKINKY